jgi:hypothetical protein
MQRSFKPSKNIFRGLHFSVAPLRCASASEAYRLKSPTRESLELLPRLTTIRSSGARLFGCDKGRYSLIAGCQSRRMFFLKRKHCRKSSVAVSEAPSQLDDLPACRTCSPMLMLPLPVDHGFRRRSPLWRQLPPRFKFLASYLPSHPFCCSSSRWQKLNENRQKKDVVSALFCVHSLSYVLFGTCTIFTLQHQTRTPCFLPPETRTPPCFLPPAPNAPRSRRSTADLL